MKTLIELFDTDMLENVISCIAFKPERVVFIGFDIPAHKRQDIRPLRWRRTAETKHAEQRVGGDRSQVEHNEKHTICLATRTT